MKNEDAVLVCRNNIKINQFCGNDRYNRHKLGYTTIPNAPKNKSWKHFRPLKPKLWYLCLLQSWPTAPSKSVDKMDDDQQYFSSVSLMEMPNNLTFFCLGSTYDTLPSPSNLKRWQMTTESKCSLWSRDVCTTAYILGPCKVSPQQGRYTFRHNIVLQNVTYNSPPSMSSLKQTIKPFLVAKSIRPAWFINKGNFVTPISFCRS